MLQQFSQKRLVTMLEFFLKTGIGSVFSCLLIGKLDLADLSDDEKAITDK